MKDQLLTYLFAVLFFGGILIGMSDGPIFPLPNLVGVAMMFLSLPLTPAAERYADATNRE